MAWWDFGADKLFKALGPSSGEKSAASLLSGIGSFATGTGESDLLAANTFWKSILSGDPAQVAKVLGPEISAINQQAQQRKKTTAEFGDRSGGTNAAMQMVDTDTRTQVNDLIASLTGSAATNLGSTGLSLLGEGVAAGGASFSAARDMKNDWITNILGALETGVSVAGAV